MHLRKLSFLPFVLALFTIITSCNDEASQLGLEILPAGDRLYVETNDTVTVTTELIEFPGEYLSTSDNVMLGIINDPFFGNIKASVISEYTLAYLFKDLKDKVADSLVLHFNFTKTKFVGDTNSVIRYNIYELRDTLSIHKNYDNTLDLNNYVDYSKLLGSGDLNFNNTHLSITLNQDYANRVAKVDSASFADDSIKRADHKLFGFYIEPQLISGNGIVSHVDFTAIDTLDNNENELRLHFHNADTSGIIYFKMKSNYYNSYYQQYYYMLPKVNLVQHTYPQSINDELSGAKKDSILPLLSTGGVKIKVDMSNLKKIKDGRLYNIGKAELIIPYDSSYYKDKLTTIPMARSFQLYVKDVNGKIYPYSYGSSKDTIYGFMPYDDKYVGSTIDTLNNTFSLNISQFVQEYLSGKTKVTDLIIMPAASSSNLSSAFLKPDKKIKLKIKYSKL